jgi:hypothetical protein
MASVRRYHPPINLLGEAQDGWVARVGEPLVICTPAVWMQVMRPPVLQVAEPSIGGYEVSALGAYVLGFPPAAVVKVVPA